MPSNGYLSILYKMLEKHLWNSFLLYLVVEILRLLHKIAVSLRCSIKQAQNTVLKNTKSSPVKRKYVPKNFAKFTEKHLFRSRLFNKVAGWKPETFRSSHWRCSVKQGALKNFANSTGDILCWSLFLIKLHFWCLQLQERRLRQQTPVKFAIILKNIWECILKNFI